MVCIIASLMITLDDPIWATLQHERGQATIEHEHERGQATIALCAREAINNGSPHRLPWLRLAFGL
jgi:hypothetical protein